ncbi:hypothetical protein [Streptomyces sp. NPDC057695]|uniref:hypothetical protein n=1 Tax=unclassified Streptomyces TaxID=2593676 RepID=UPI003644CF3C
MAFKRRAALALVPTLVLLLGGCMSDAEKNEPLPRMSKDKAESWAAHWAGSMARTAEAKLVAGDEKASFTDCLGKGGESADDGRFTLRYSVKAALPKARQADGIRAIKDELEKQGFEIQGYRSDPAVKPVNLVDARHPKDRQAVTAEDLDDTSILLVVRTPCLLPPDAEQQEF